MSISGTIEHDELLTALRLVARGRRTGVLLVKTAYANASVAFEDGDVLWANTTTTPRLGELLVDRGLVKRDKLDAALWVQKQDREWRALGRVLLDVKLVSRAVVEIAVEAQILQVLDVILRWDTGAFRFEERPPESGARIPPSCRDLGQLELKVAKLRQQRSATSSA
jgi:hypothetical protein